MPRIVRPLPRIRQAVLGNRSNFIQESPAGLPPCFTVMGYERPFLIFWSAAEVSDGYEHPGGVRGQGSQPPRRILANGPAVRAEPPPEGYETWEEFAEAQGINLESGTDIDSAIDPDRTGPRLLFERDDPHPRGAVHLDINVAAGFRTVQERRSIVDEEVARLTAAGAITTRVVDREDHYWVEMTDPEGNWFCVQ